MKLWIDLAGVVIEIILLAYYMHMLLGPLRCPWYGGLGAYLILGLCLWGISYYIPDAKLRTISYLIAGTVALMALYEHKIWTNMFAAFCFICLSVIVDYGVHAFLMLSSGEVYATGANALEDYVLGSSISKCLMIVLTQALVEYLRRSKSKIGQLTIGDFALLLCYPLVNMIALFMLYRATIANNDMYEVVDLLVIAILLLAANVGIFVLFNKMRTANQLLQENILAKQQLASQQQFYSAQAERSRAQRAWQHDLKNKLAAIAGYIQSGQPQQALAQLAQMEVAISRAAPQRTGSIAIDAILDNKQQLAQDMDIQLQYTLNLFEPIQIEAMDLVVVLANGLDNALEAAARFPDPAGLVITCSISIKQGWLKVIITNPVVQRVEITGPKIPTSKKDSLYHGLGLTNVRHITERYHGNLYLQCDEESFTFTAILSNANRS